jgi:hypothetical protein
MNTSLKNFRIVIKFGQVVPIQQGIEQEVNAWIDENPLLKAIGIYNFTIRHFSNSGIVYALVTFDLCYEENKNTETSIFETFPRLKMFILPTTTSEITDGTLETISYFMFDWLIFLPDEQDVKIRSENPSVHPCKNPHQCLGFNYIILPVWWWIREKSSAIIQYVPPFYFQVPVAA